MADVTNIPKRGPYGLKYTVADLTPFIAGKLGIADAVAINLATAHDTPGTAPQYRRNARTQASVLLLVGRIVWGVRKEFRTLAAQGFVRSAVGFEPEGERIAAYQIGGEGITLRLVSGGGLWVPWNALELAGVVKALNSRVISAMHEHHEVDDEARELRFPPAGIVLKVDMMLDRAKKNEANDRNDIVLLTDVPRW